MDNLIEKRRAFIINFVYAVICIGLLFVFMKYCLGVLAPFIIAFVLAFVLQRPIKWVQKKLHLKSHGIISFILVLLVVCFVGGLLSIALLLLFNELKDFANYLTTQFSSIDEVINTIENYLMSVVVRLPEGIRTTVSEYLNNAFDSLGEGKSQLDLSMLSAPLSGAWSVVKSLPSTILACVVAVVSCFFVTSDYDKIKELFLSFFSENKRKYIVKTKRTATKAIGKLLKAYITIMAITFAEMFLGLFLLKLIGVYDGSYIAIISFVTCIIDIIPVLGTGTVLIPWALYNLIFGNFGMGIGLVVIYAVVTVIRQIIEPKLVANQAGLPAIVTIMAMFLGVRIFGAFGIILLPFTVIILKLLYDEGVFSSKKVNNKSENTEKTEGLAEAKKND
ncbi:MAG: sporulation integral membrane protein YtvI [Ruminococcaceae bacterium]|nr:sporulation integral membrane protein YtvI [Oscillospiraceae bacterium]